MEYEDVSGAGLEGVQFVPNKNKWIKNKLRRRIIIEFNSDEFNSSN